MIALERKLNNESFKPIANKLMSLGIPKEYVEVLRYNMYKDNKQLPDWLKNEKKGIVDKVTLNNMNEELVLLLGIAFCKQHSFYEDGIGIITF